MTKIPLDTILSLVREFGLLINQVAIYGIAHKIIQGQAVVFFNNLIQLVTTYDGVEFSIQGDKVTVNGSTDSIDLMTVRNLREKMLLHKLPSISFLPVLTQQEFLTFLSYLGTPPVRIQDQGGFAALIKQANIEGVLLDHIVYKRVSTKEKPSEPASPTWAVKKTEAPPVDPSTLPPAQARTRREQVKTEFLSLLAEVTQLISEEGDLEIAEQNQKVIDTLRSIRDTLRESTEPSKERIATLLGHADYPAPGKFNAPLLKKKPKPLKLTHKEYLERYAELTQEIAQPLTVTNGVIELLQEGHAGALTEMQMQFLNLALDSVDRVNQLIRYMHTLSGEPESYQPDTKIVKETYV